MVSTETYRERNYKDRDRAQTTGIQRERGTKIHNCWEETPKFPSASWCNSILTVVFWLLKMFPGFIHNTNYQKPIVINQWYCPLVKRSQRFVKGKDRMKCELEKGVF